MTIQNNIALTETSTDSSSLSPKAPSRNKAKSALKVTRSDSASEGLVMPMSDALPDPAILPQLYPRHLLDLQLLKCRTLRACCNGGNQRLSEALHIGAVNIMAKFDGGRDVMRAKGIESSVPAMTIGDTAQPSLCAQMLSADGAVCPTGGCPLPDGSIACNPEELLRWDGNFKTVGHVNIAKSIVASEFGSKLLVDEDDSLYAPEDGAYRRIDDNRVTRTIISHLGVNCKVVDADAIRKMILVTSSQKTVGIAPSGNHICFTNGTFNVLRGTLGSHDTTPSLFNHIPHDYVANSSCPNFMAFLDSIWNGDNDARQKHQFIQQWMGYLLTADSSQQKMLILKGEGANGKSVLMDIARHLVGEKNTSSAMLGRLHMPYVRATLDKKLLNQSADLPKLGSVADGDLKAIIGGDSIEVSPKYKPSFTIKPYARLMVATNNMPRSSDTTEGYFRRLIVLTFNRGFVENERNPLLLSELLTEMPGIVAWAVDGLRALRAAGRFIIPPSSVQEVDAYREELSPAAVFADECLDLSGDRSGIRSRDIFMTFKRWCGHRGFNAGNMVTLGRELVKLGFPHRKSGNTVWLVKPTESGREYFASHRIEITSGRSLPSTLQVQVGG